jgi:hypothetical protein
MKMRIRDYIISLLLATLAGALLFGELSKETPICSHTTDIEYLQSQLDKTIQMYQHSLIEVGELKVRIERLEK